MTPEIVTYLDVISEPTMVYRALSLQSEFAKMFFGLRSRWYTFAAQHTHKYQRALETMVT